MCIGIGEYDKGSFYKLHTPVERGGFSLAFGLVEYGGLRPTCKAFVGMVVTAVRNPEYL